MYEDSHDWQSIVRLRSVDRFRNLLFRSARNCVPVRRQMEHGRVTASGHCGKIPIGLGISHGRIYSTGGSFVFHPIQLGGRVAASGQVRMNAVAGPRMAHGTGRFGRLRGSGTWAGTGPSGLCSGVWSAFHS
jgi:hypothetical protein